jgi:putative component of toxin-antitoxin plasmid stabilization module
VVDSADTFAKDDFPDKRVYADTRDAEVRLITCAGDYDHSARDYTENLVVFAHLV